MRDQPFVGGHITVEVPPENVGRQNIFDRLSVREHRGRSPVIGAEEPPTKSEQRRWSFLVGKLPAFPVHS
jgi:hypothetical protein